MILAHITRAIRAQNLTEAVSRFNGYYDLGLRLEDDSVKDIHAAFDARLQIDHGENQ